VGKKVLLKLRPYVQSSVGNRPCPKLAPKYFGPYSLVARIGTVAYKLQMQENSQVHPMFHVSHLKPYTPDFSLVFSELPSVPQLDIAELQPETILDRRLTKKGNDVVIQVLIKWSSLPTEMATWEDFYVVKKRYPMAPAWG
jgi:hypothetical protein